MRDTILVFKQGQWVYEEEMTPEWLGHPMFKCKIGTGWTDKQVSEFVDQYLSEYLNEDE